MENENVTFTVSADNGQFGGQLDMSISISRDSTLDEVLQVFERMALALTYQPASLTKAYRERLAEMNEVDALHKEQIRADLMNEIFPHTIKRKYADA
jgi:hypothetical protein